MISAILSTVSSQLLVAASAVSYDVVEGALGYGADDRRSLTLGRLTVVVIGALGILVALSEVRLVFWFVLFAWSGLGAAFAPLMLFVALDRFSDRVQWFVVRLVRYERAYLMIMGIVHGFTNLGGSLLTAMVHARNHPRDVARANRNAPRKLVVITSSHSSSLMRGSRVSRVTPALLIRMSSRSHFSITSSTTLSTLSRLRTSQGKASA